jgi:hypothetical protein
MHQAVKCFFRNAYELRFISDCQLTYRPGWYRGTDLVLRSGGTLFESQLDYRLSLVKYFCAFYLSHQEISGNC